MAISFHFSGLLSSEMLPHLLPIFYTLPPSDMMLESRSVSVCTGLEWLFIFLGGGGGGGGGGVRGYNGGMG